MSQYTWVYCDQGQGSWALGARGTRWWARQAARRADVQARGTLARGALALSTRARGARAYRRGVQRAQRTRGRRLAGRPESRRERGRGARLSARGRAGWEAWAGPGRAG